MILGISIVIAAVIGGFLGAGGHLGALWQPFEVVIIVGAALGAFLISNPKDSIHAVSHGIGLLLKGQRFKKENYMELLLLLYTVFKFIRIKGILTLEPHVENPKESSIFEKFPLFKGNAEVVTFFCDYMRLLTIGTDNPQEIEELLDSELIAMHGEHHKGPVALQNVADGMPALGIVAAVLGVIHTMGSISEPPEVLGHMIGGALVGTFLGVLLSYGFVGPIGQGIDAINKKDMKYYECIKVALIAHLKGNDPTISVEFARKGIEDEIRPTFTEVEQAISALPNPATL